MRRVSYQVLHPRTGHQARQRSRLQSPQGLWALTAASSRGSALIYCQFNILCRNGLYARKQCMGMNVPVRPSAKTTWVGLSCARIAAKNALRVLRSRIAVYNPSPRPTADPTVVQRETVEAADLSASRSSAVRSCCICWSASLASSSLRRRRRRATDSAMMRRLSQMQVGC